jgi:hypothetical protein
MNGYEPDLLLASTDAITDVSYGVVYVLCAAVMLIPVAMLVALIYGARRERKRRVTHDTQS